jgi:hypothetical protein
MARPRNVTSSPGQPPRRRSLFLGAPALPRKHGADAQQKWHPAWLEDPPLGVPKGPALTFKHEPARDVLMAQNQFAALHAADVIERGLANDGIAGDHMVAIAQLSAADSTRAGDNSRSVFERGPALTLRPDLASGPVNKEASSRRPASRGRPRSRSTAGRPCRRDARAPIAGRRARRRCAREQRQERPAALAMGPQRRAVRKRAALRCISAPAVTRSAHRDTETARACHRNGRRPRSGP